MKLVVDTNILFSFFWKDSVTKKFIINSGVELISPVTALDELKKYKNDIIKKSKVTNKEFDLILEEIKVYVQFVKKEEYLEHINSAKEISPDEKDADFLALCKRYSCCLWSNDDILKNQNEIEILSIKDVLELIF